ncbi:MAG: hypothetical protein KAS57_00815 [Gammaproteobacteria bacterium]|nr:hypothetical protein [Gammaproteobacteria bacterium]
MKILKYLIKPLELIVFLCMLAALVYFRSIIFHSNVNQYIDQALVYAEEQFEIEIPSHVNNDIELKNVVQAECESIEVDVVKNDELIDSKEVVAQVKGNDAAAELNSTDEEVKSEGEQALIETLSEAVNMINQKVDTLFDMNKSAPVAEPVLQRNDEISSALPVQKDSNLTDSKEIAVVSVEDASAVDTKQVIEDARKLFWNGNIQGSEKLYLELASIDAGDPDVYGELGNVYYTQGKWKLAGEAYYEAAIRLLAQKNNDQVSNRIDYLLRVIQGLDTESAEKLKNKISG